MFLAIELTLQTFKLYFYDFGARARAIASPNYFLVSVAESNGFDVEGLLKHWASGTIKNHLFTPTGVNDWAIALIGSRAIALSISGVYRLYTQL